MKIIKTKSFEIAINERGNLNSEKLAIILPGRLDTKDYECFNSHLDCFAKLGYYAISIDPPSTWDSPGDINLYTTTNYIKAVNELIEYLGNRQTILFGHSRGGLVASIVGTNNAFVKGIITINSSLGKPEAPASGEIKDNIYITYRDLPPGTEKTKEQKRFEIPMSYFEDGKKYNGAEELKKCFKAKLILYGKNDSNNSIESVREVFDSIPESKSFCELECGHNYRYFPKIVDEVNEEIKSFMEKFF